MVELADRLTQWRFEREAELPLPGAGHTPERLRQLADWGRQDLSLARVAEAHTDALAILAEAGRTPRAGALYGVWASDGPHGRVTAKRLADGGWRLDGVKQYCSGAAFATSALMTAHGERGVLLFDVCLDHPRLRVLPSTWATPALADTATAPVALDAVTLASDALVGGEDWYLKRPGFWHGALGPAACWAGGARSLVEAARALNRRDPHSRAQVGALLAAAWALDAVLEQAGRQTDRDPADAEGQARPRALMLRHVVERHCTDILDRFGRATGPQLLCFDAQVARQHLALTVYIRQCHAERDLENVLAP